MTDLSGDPTFHWEDFHSAGDNLSGAAHDAGYKQGRADLRDEILDVMEAPPTDDPIDTLKRIAEVLEAFVDDGYDYFDQRGQWVLFPSDPTGGAWWRG